MSCCGAGEGIGLTSMAVGDAERMKEVVRRQYGASALQMLTSQGKGGCGCGCGDAGTDLVSSNLYDELETCGLPESSVAASLGCGNPTALAELREGEVVLDLGSGGRIDVLLSANRVGPRGKAYGVDMTEEMLELARENRCAAGLDNAEFLKGDIEAVPLPDAHVDVVISNCVINLAANKRKALSEAFRVLRPGGRFAVSDVVVRGDLPSEVRQSLEHWVGCVAGALEEQEFRSLLEEVGFVDVEIEPTRVYGKEDARVLSSEAGVRTAQGQDAAAGEAGLVAAFVRGRKPLS